MSLYWLHCFLCDGRRKLDIGENYNKFFKTQNIECPLCQGKGQLVIKSYKKNPLKKNRKDCL